jgi:hypothetical protein
VKPYADEMELLTTGVKIGELEKELEWIGRQK